MSTRAISRDDICGLVVSYFPKPGFAENLAALAPQVGAVLIVDNGTSGQSSDLLDRAAEMVGARIMRLGKNLGIAAALNAGIEVARDNGYVWLATFDQDSQATPHMIQQMLDVLQSYRYSDRVAIVSPCHIDDRLGFRVRERRQEAAAAGWRIVYVAMTSGNLLRLDAAAAVGGFDDSLFIDYVDIEFCLRLRNHGYQVLEATRAELRHSLGRLERRVFLCKYVTITNHPAERRYYMTRNRLLIWRQYYRRQPVWMILDIRRFLFETVYVMIYEKQVGVKLRMILRGVWHGLTNVRGIYGADRD
jgi:rhamnosyltransferase